MSSASWPVYTPFAREHYGRGKAKGEARTILIVLSSRGLEISDEARARITSCTDLEQLDIWARRAGTIGSLDELFT